MTSDLELIQAYKKGDQKAFELLYKKYKKMLNIYIYCTVRNQHIYYFLFSIKIKGIKNAYK